MSPGLPSGAIVAALRRAHEVLEGAGSSTTPLAVLLSPVVAHHVVGTGALPTYLGLTAADLAALEGAAFGAPGALDATASEVRRLHPALAAEAADLAELRAELAEARGDERDELVELLMTGVPVEEPAIPATTARRVARVLASGCLGRAHLWSACGFATRADLRAILELCFPALAAGNDRDMRWKRFFYRQLCERGGDFVCRAPSCDECSSRAECFVDP